MGRQGWYPRAIGAKPCGLEDQVEDLRLNSAEVYVRAGDRPLRGHAWMEYDRAISNVFLILRLLTGTVFAHKLKST